MRNIGLDAAGIADYEVKVDLLDLLADLHFKHTVLIVILEAHIGQYLLHLLEIILKLLCIAFAVKRAGRADRKLRLERKAVELLN